MKRAIGVLLIVIALVTGLGVVVYAEDPISSSTDPQAIIDAQNPPVTSFALPEGASYVITFSEYDVGTHIDTQYRKVGIIFGGDDPYITTDSANPTSPVLSGTPRYQGDIIGTFVEPGTDNPTVVESFTFDAGYFDFIGSTGIEWFDPGHNSLGQITNSQIGIEQFTIEGGNIASWQITYGVDWYGIDNVFFVPTQYHSVGGEVYPVNKVGLVVPWIALAAAIAVGGFYLVRRRAHSYK